MKKIITILLLFLFVCVVKAETSLDLIVSELKTSDYYSFYNTNNSNVSISNDENSLTINYINSNDGVSCQTIFSYYSENSTFVYSGGLCTYLNDTNNTGLDLITYSSKIDGTWINELINVIGKLRGYSKEQILEWRKTVNIYDLYIDKDGLEAEKNSENVEEYSTNKGQDFAISLDNFKIDITKLKLSQNIKVDKKFLNLDINPSILVLFMVTILLYIVVRRFKK